ncbi:MULTISPECIES: NACHT C-terminal helical domain 2-containing protein [Nostoc]|uniref:Helix-turn-helix domain-containing protein n=1 Tax=Nostoc paludosum FACHB-159 TaxID=2692908 RepID=A0ABR8K875_9NOSO|nr:MULTISPECIES: helix-turn-helix domain-containing protein [Nostoc]MBD2676842.1 helix-turn-helix domain-containing protein [Nostoc sp. FACHB-857]MBD2735029.1 helix-turn-helix domain-containing protein [Nostoc paludosum FACHB-159]
MARAKKNKEAGEAFKKLLKEKNFTQYKLEQVTGLDKSVISKIATGQTANPTPTTLQKIAAALGVELGELTRIFAQSAVQSQPQESVSKVSISNNSDFVGREQAIAHLDKLVNEGAKVILIHAEGGIGKTTLATKWFELQGLECLELRVGSTPQNLNSIEDWVRFKLRYYFKENPEQNFMIMLEQLKTQLQMKKIGVLINNLETALINGEFIELQHSYYIELLNVLAHYSVHSVTLITSRELIYEPLLVSNPNFKNYRLESLLEEAWKHYFESIKIQIDSDALREMHRAYGGNAEVMYILSGDIATTSQGSLKNYWQEHQDDLLRHPTLEKLVQRQFNKLKNDNLQAYQLLCRLACYPNQDIMLPKVWLFCLLWDVPKNRQQRIINELCDRSLIKDYNEEYYLHPVIRQALVEKFSTIDNRNNTQLVLIKQKIDEVLESQQQLQSFLIWVQQKSISVNCNFTQPSIKAFYFYLALRLNHTIDHLCPNPVVAFFEDDFNPQIAFALGLELTINDKYYNEVYLDIELAYAFADAPKKADIKQYNLEPDLVHLLQTLENKILDYSTSMSFLYGGGYENSWQDDWSNEVKDLAGKLRLMLIKYRNIGHDWKFTKRQWYLIQQYYNANKLLVDCLNQASDKVRSHIEDTLLLPIAEIEKRPFKN